MAIPMAVIPGPTTAITALTMTETSLSTDTVMAGTMAIIISRGAVLDGKVTLVADGAAEARTATGVPTAADARAAAGAHAVAGVRAAAAGRADGNSSHPDKRGL